MHAPPQGSSPTGLYAPLDAPPTATALTVRKLLGRVQAGAIRVPPFQRPLRWSGEDVVKLFDSLLRGYPIGSLLFWKRALEAAPSLLVGNARFPVPAVDDGWYIVDGQQRVTALAATLLDLDQHGDPRWTVRFDPEANQFLMGEATSPRERKTHVPLGALGDLRRLSKWLRDCDLDERGQSRVEEVQQRLLDYEIPAYVVETSDVDALRGVFARLNSTGVRMRADEVFQALLGSDGSRAAGHRTIDLPALQKACDLDDFGQPPRPEVMKALLAMSGFDPTRRIEELGDGVAEKLVDTSEAADALQRTVSFLQRPIKAAEPGAGIAAYAFMPYPAAFVILARWFYLFPRAEDATRAGLARWLWRGVVSGAHQRAAVSAMRLQVRQIKPDLPDDSLRALLAATGDPPDREWPLNRFHARNAGSRVETLMLLDRQPLDDSGPVSWKALLSSGERVAREIIRSSSWDELSPSARELAHTIANRVLLDSRHTGLGGTIRSWTWERHREQLESHLIDERGLHLLQTDPSAFLVHRGARIRAEVARFLAERAGIGEPLVLARQSYFTTDEEP